jgi:hypothetical protein
MSNTSKSIGYNEFVKALLVGAKAKQTIQDVAEALGVTDKKEVDSLRSRYHALKQKWTEGATKDPKIAVYLSRIQLADGRGRKPGSGKKDDFSVVDSLLAELDGLDDEAPQSGGDPSEEGDMTLA